MKNICLIIVVLALSTSCTKYVENKPDVAKSQNLFVTDTTLVRADGQSRIRLVLDNKYDLKPESTVNFEASPGTVINPDTLIAPRTTARIQVGRDPAYFNLAVTVKTGSTVLSKKQLSFYLKPARPDAIKLETNRTYYSVKSNPSITIKIFVNRHIGKVSIGAPISALAFQLDARGDTIRIGRFAGVANNASDTNEKFSDITLNTDTNNIDTLRTITIQAKTKNDKGQYIFSRQQLSYHR